MTTSLEQQLEALTAERDEVLAQVKGTKDEWGTVLERFGDEGIAHIASTSGWDDINKTNQLFKKCADALEKDHSKAHPTGEVDWSEVLRAQDLFTRYGNEIGSALLLAALPQTYATERGSKVLVAASGLETDLTRRVRGTAQFLMLVMLATKAPEGPESYESCNSYLQKEDERRLAVAKSWDPSGVRWRVCATLRVHHEAIRRMQRDRNKSFVALNQEDLLGALLTFTITVFEVLEQFGISWTDADQLAYLRTWNLIGKSLGITGFRAAITGSPYSSPFQQGLPQTVGEARLILDALRARNWKPLDTYGGDLLEELTQTDPGVRLIAALLAELSAELPGTLKRLPEVVVRQLAAPVVRDRLGLGDGGLMQAGADYLPGVFGAVKFVPGAGLAIRARASWLRQAANTVCRAATVHFVRSEPDLPEFIIPGLVDWSDSLRTQTASRQPGLTIHGPRGADVIHRAVEGFSLGNALGRSKP